MVSDELSVVVVSVPDVVASVGLPISVVDSGTLVVNVVEVSDGVMTNVCLSRVSVGADCVVTGVVNTVFCGLLHSPDICTTVYTRAAMRAGPDTAGGERGRRRPVPGLVARVAVWRHVRRS